MKLHPTIVAASGAVATEMLELLEEEMARSLGDGREVLAHVNPPRPEHWARALRELHDVGKVGRLERRGYRLDCATNAVWLAELHDPELPELLAALETGVEAGLTGGRELRLHMLLLLPDLFSLNSGQRKQAEDNLALLRPTGAAPLPMRVWPLSIRNRADLYVGNALDLLPLVRHFIEFCLFRNFPFHPTTSRGRDWAAVGGCQMLAVKPSARNFAADVWYEIRHLSPRDLWPPSGTLTARANEEVPEGTGRVESWDWAAFFAWLEALRSAPPRVVPEVPPCPAALPCDLDRDPPPICPRRQSCSEHPRWELDRDWKIFGEGVKVRCIEEIAEKVELVEQGLPERLVVAAVPLGLAGIEELRNRLEKAFVRASADLDKALEPFDQLFGVTLVRRWRARGSKGSLPVVASGLSLSDLEARLAQVDGALDACDLDFFLQSDAQVRQAEESLAEVRASFELNERLWNERFEKKDASTAPDAAAAAVPWWRRALRWIVNLPRKIGSWLFSGFAPPEEEEDTVSRKRLCDRAQQLIDQGYELQVQKWERTREWLQRWAEYRVLRAYRDAVLSALEHCQELLGAAERVELKPVASSERSLVLPLDLPQSLVRSRARELAGKLVRDGILSLLLDPNTDEFTAALLREAERELAEFPKLELEELLDDRAWEAAFKIGAPRVMVAHRPEQERYTWVFCDAQPPRVFEKSMSDLHWRRGEAVLLRFLLPIAPEDILGDVDVPPLSLGGEGSTGEFASGWSEPRDDRPNELLERAFYG